MFLTLLFGLAGLIENALSAPNAGKAPTATIDAGAVVGTTVSVPGASATVVNKFLGIPFAASPTRFAPPATPTPWSQPYDATNFSFTCPQQFSYPAASRAATMAFFNLGLQADVGEDCLNLNIWAPATGDGGKAVMVWIYGGGLQFGSNSIIFYDGSSMAANQDVIVVAINYRTNIFGFPGSPQLPITENNLGFLDQRLALDWVQRNIHAFGGDPDRVTIFGESAGGASVDALVLTHPSNPPFSGAISESGTANLYGALNAQNYPMPWNAAVQAVNCSSASDILACVRAVPQPVLTDVIEHLASQFTPVIDNVTNRAHPESVRLSGNIAQVPVMTGTNANEGRIFTLPFVNATSSIPYLMQVYHLTTQQAEALASLYPIGSVYISNAYTQIAQIFTEYSFQCPAHLVQTDMHAAHLPVWRYLYNGSFANLNPLGTALDLGAYHSSEIPMVFGTYPIVGATEEQKRISEYMQTSWATFAKNPAGGPGWAGYPNVEVLGPDATNSGVGYGESADSLDSRCSAFQAAYTSLGVY